ncbi:response regulator transcription factor [Acidaminobacter sp.]|uniref:response regulator transcription factor n=1 Tax=Acidaminobacter sp. TaxID=1872102 RepID=UPI0025695EC8|nr:response regulator transcription factor [Acidaminobacter sp.]MDK9710016.1 response regulator transcription factor [Acidaminobacter sp.]
MTRKTKILLIEDEASLAEVIKEYLTASGYDVITAHDGTSGVDLARREEPALILLDLMLPDLPGEEVCTAIRKWSRVPIIILTAKSQEEDLLNGLGLGADDYVTKPFSPRQLVARIAALLRRSSEDPTLLSNRMSYQNGDLVIDTLAREIWKSGDKVSLTPNEYKILLALACYPRKVFTRGELIEIALGSDYDGFDRGIDSHIKNIRQKIESDSKAPQYIRTVHGIGYRFGGDVD